jgi:hypothetical protein
MLEILFSFRVWERELAGPKDARHHPMKAMTYQCAMSLSGPDRRAQTVKPAAIQYAHGPVTSNVRHPENL